MTEFTSDAGFSDAYRQSVSASPKARVWFINVGGGVQPLNHNAKVFGGELALVLEPNMRCHIVSHGTDEKVFHAQIEKLAMEGQKNLAVQKVEVVYKHFPVSKENPNQQSRVDFLFPNGQKVHILATSTHVSSLRDISAMITVSAE